MDEVIVHRRVKENDPIIGFKTLSIDRPGGYLRSVHYTVPWRDGWIKADRRPSKRGQGSGIYAYRERMNEFHTRLVATPGVVVVKVGLWGKVVEFRDKHRTDGFMAHNATVREVWVADYNQTDYAIVREMLPDSVVVHRPLIKQPVNVTVETDKRRNERIISQLLNDLRRQRVPSMH